MTTDETLQIIFSDKNADIKLAMNENTLKSIKKRFRDGRYISERIKDKIISKYGGVLIQDKQWLLPGEQDHQK